MLDLKSLKYFCAAYEEKSISKAARKCSIAQPSITLAIQNLEDQMNCRLFFRSRSGLTPTQEGAKLYPLAQNLLSQAQNIAHEFSARKLMEINLYLQPDVHIETAGPLIHLLATEWPQASLRMSSDRKSADLRLIEYQCKSKSEFFFPLWSETYVALLTQQSPLRSKTSLGIQDLQGAPLIERSSCLFHKKFKLLLKQNGIAPDIRAIASQEEEVLKLVELGIGIAIAPKSHAQLSQKAVVRPLKDALNVSRQIGLACHSTNFETKAIVKKVGSLLKTI